MTLNEVMSLDGINLFQKHDYIDYPHVVRMIIDRFGEQEVAYPAPDLFKRKLNLELGLHCHNYNKMLQAQLITIDPFVTEYIVSQGKDSTRSKEGETETTENTRDTGTQTRGFDKSSESTTANTATSGAHSKQNVETQVGGKLYSEAENKDAETTRNLETTNNEKTDYSENTSEENTKNVSGTKDTTKTDNQTGRNWTENGSSVGHNLDVHSDMPQAMLFNQPKQYYYGTGREHIEGKVLTDEHGKKYVVDFAETDPNQIDSARLENGGGDNPWYNYATDANNKTGHDSYNKEGTETYQKSGSENTTETEDTTDDTTKDITGNKTVATTGNEDETTHNAEGRALNSNEHTKTDATHDEAFKEQGTEDKTSESSSNSEDYRDTSEHQNAYGKGQRALHRDDDRNTYSVFRGRRMMSPSKLLAEYRETLTFNADMWLLGELEPLFMMIF